MNKIEQINSNNSFKIEESGFEATSPLTKIFQSALETLQSIQSDPMPLDQRVATLDQLDQNADSAYLKHIETISSIWATVWYYISWVFNPEYCEEFYQTEVDLKKLHADLFQASQKVRDVPRDLRPEMLKAAGYESEEPEVQNLAIGRLVGVMNREKMLSHEGGFQLSLSTLKAKQDDFFDFAKERELPIERLDLSVGDEIDWELIKKASQHVKLIRLTNVDCPLTIPDFSLVNIYSDDTVVLLGFSEDTLCSFPNYQEIDLTHAKINTDLLPALVQVKKVKLPSFIEIGENPLPSFENPLTVRKLYGQSHNLISYMKEKYTGPKEYAVLLPGVQYEEQTYLDPDSVFFRLQENNPYITEIDAYNVETLNDENIEEFLSCYPNALTITLTGTRVTIDKMNELLINCKKADRNPIEIRNYLEVGLEHIPKQKDVLLLNSTDVETLTIDNIGQLLAKFPDVNDLDLTGTAITSGEIDSLRVLYPKIRINKYPAPIRPYNITKENVMQTLETSNDPDTIRRCRFFMELFPDESYPQLDTYNPDVKDLHIICDGRQFDVSRYLWSCRSLRLRNHFRTGDVKQQNTFQTDESPYADLAEIVIDFINGKEINILPNQPEGILWFADYFEQEKLIDLCLEVLINRIRDSLLNDDWGITLANIQATKTQVELYTKTDINTQIQIMEALIQEDIAAESTDGLRETLLQMLL